MDQNLSLDPLYLYFNYNEATGIDQVGDRSNGSGLRCNLLGQPAKGEALVIRNGQVVFER